MNTIQTGRHSIMQMTALIQMHLYNKRFSLLNSNDQSNYIRIFQNQMHKIQSKNRIFSTINFKSFSCQVQHHHLRGDYERISQAKKQQLMSNFCVLILSLSHASWGF